MDIYNSTFAGFLVANAVAGYLQYSPRKVIDTSSSVKLGDVQDDDDERKPVLEHAHNSRLLEHTHNPRLVRNFKLTFLIVYSLVMGSDWLQVSGIHMETRSTNCASSADTVLLPQGPYQYALYKDERQLPEQTVGFLFAVGFSAAAISASFVGSMADKHGRRKMCLAFCVMYASSCLTKIFSNLPVLFLGRVLGGVSTTLLYSVFEAWMVQEHSARGLHNMGLPLNDILGQMATCSSLSAIAAGVLGQVLVDYFGTNVAPFLGSVVLLGLAFLVVLRRWVSTKWLQGTAWRRTARRLLTGACSQRTTAHRRASTATPARVWAVERACGRS